MDTISRRARDEIDPRLSLEHAQRDIERERIAGAATVAIGSDDGDLPQREKGLAEAANAFRTKAVIIADQYFHAVEVFEVVGRGR